jgi:hypothetical protein
MALEHLRMVRVSRKLLAPSQVIIRSLPQPVVDERVTAGHFVEQDVPCELPSNVTDVPTGGLVLRREIRMDTNAAVDCPKDSGEVFLVAFGGELHGHVGLFFGGWL